MTILDIYNVNVASTVSTAATRAREWNGSEGDSKNFARKSSSESPPVKYWEIIADNLHKAGWSLGWVTALDLEGRTIWIVDAHRDDGRRFIVHADEKLSAFVQLERQVLTV